MTIEKKEQLLRKYNISASKSAEDILEVLEIKFDAISEKFNRTNDADLKDELNDLQDLMSCLRNLAQSGQLLEELESGEKKENSMGVESLRDNRSNAFNTNVSINNGQGANVQNTASVALWFTSLTGSDVINNLFIQAEDCLKYGQWEQADRVFDSIIATEPKNPGVFLGKAMAEFKIKTPQEITQNTNKDLDNSINLRKARDFGDKQQAKFLQDVLEERRNNMMYREASQYASNGSVSDLKRAAVIFESISLYRDAAMQAAECRRRAQDTEKQEKEQERMNKNVELMRSLLSQFKTIPLTDVNGMKRMAEDIKKLRESAPETKRVASDSVIRDTIDKQITTAEKQINNDHKEEKWSKISGVLALVAAGVYLYFYYPILLSILSSF